MRIITEPTVELISRTEFLGSTTFDIPEDGDQYTRLGSFAAKVCYDSKGKAGRPNVENQRAVLEHRHGSVLEHINFGLYITGVTRGLTLELNRHRSFAISQRSTRYTAEEDASIVLDPYYTSLYTKYGHFTSAPVEDDISGVEDCNMGELRLLDGHLTSLRDSFNAYRNEVERLTTLNPNNLSGFELRKWCRGKARNLLPHSLESRGVWTNNVRGWRWFIESRSDAHAEPEIRRLADRVLCVLYKEAPLYFGDFSSSHTVDGIPVWIPTYHKV